MIKSEAVVGHGIVKFSMLKDKKITHSKNIQPECGCC